MNYITLKPGDEIRAGDEYRHSDGRWLSCRSTIGLTVVEDALYKYRRPIPDQQQATETPETEALCVMLTNNYNFTGDIEAQVREAMTHLIRHANSLERRLHVQTARADRLAVALANMREVYGEPKWETYRYLNLTKEDFERAVVVDQTALSALASEGPTLALAQELEKMKEKSDWSKYPINPPWLEGDTHEWPIAAQVNYFACLAVSRQHELSTALVEVTRLKEDFSRTQKEASEWLREYNRAESDLLALRASTVPREEHDKVLSILPECRLWAEYARLNAHRDSFERIDKLIAVLSELSTTRTEPAKE